MSWNNSNTDILLAGAFAAFSVDLLVYPLDTLKTRLQSPQYKRLYVNSATNAVNKQAMFRGLYQGLGSVIIATLPSSGAFFTTYERTKNLLTEVPLRLPQPVIHATASSLAELVSCAILTPAEVIKQNAQMVQNSPSPFTTSIRQNATVQTLARFRHNPFALWRGYTALAGRNLPFTALQFPLFERLKERMRDWRRQQGKRHENIFETGGITAVSAGLAGSVAAVVTTPVDVIKTRIMLAAADDGHHRDHHEHGGKSAGGKGGFVDALGKQPNSLKAIRKAKSMSTWSVGRQVMAEEGFKGLWRGGALRAVWTMVGSGLYLGVYESGRIYLAQRRGEGLNVEELL